mmetsp:Transcript_49659/g.146786  ORF Transcript_49659/g.146786 Transcript_49659/m.146786 type:complete len:391 (+) Transcript_49659:280-1452(+)
MVNCGILALHPRLGATHGRGRVQGGGLGRGLGGGLDDLRGAVAEGLEVQEGGLRELQLGRRLVVALAQDLELLLKGLHLLGLGVGGCRTAALLALGLLQGSLELCHRALRSLQRLLRSLQGGGRPRDGGRALREGGPELRRLIREGLLRLLEHEAVEGAARGDRLHARGRQGGPEGLVQLQLRRVGHQGLHVLLRLLGQLPGAVEEGGEVLLHGSIEGLGLGLLGGLRLLGELHGALRGLLSGGRLGRGRLCRSHLVLRRLHGLELRAQVVRRRLAGGPKRGHGPIRRLHLLRLLGKGGTLRRAHVGQDLRNHGHDLVLAWVALLLHHVEAALRHGDQQLTAVQRDVLRAVDRHDDVLEALLLRAKARLLLHRLLLRGLGGALGTPGSHR